MQGACSYIKRGIYENFSGYEAYYTACSLLEVLKNSFSKLHCQKCFNLGRFTYRIRSRPSSNPARMKWSADAPQDPAQDARALLREGRSEPEMGSSSSCPIALTCTARRRVPASVGANEGPATGDLMMFCGAGGRRTASSCTRRPRAALGWSPPTLKP